LLSGEPRSATEKFLASPHPKTSAGPFSYESLIEDHAWRFDLIRSTFEDLDQLIEDKRPRFSTGPCAARAA
jgi:hypothetical protein